MARKLLLILAVSLAFFTVCLSSLSYAVDYTQDANCVGAWLMNVDEDPITDSSGEGNTGALLAADNPDFIASAKYDGGYSFGGDDYIDVTDDATLQITGNITSMCWVNADSFPSSGQFRALIEKKYDGSKEGYYLMFYSQLGTPQIRAGSYDGTSNYTIWNHDWSTGEWHHFVGLYDGAYWRIYADGINEASTLDNTGAVDSTGDVYFGAANINGSIQRYFTGDMDEAAIFNDALDSTEINDIMDNGLVGGAPPAGAIRQSGFGSGISQGIGTGAR